MNGENFITRFEVSHPKHVQYLYHWQRFCADRLTTTLRERKIWCSRPSAFNDPWDCKPHYKINIQNMHEISRYIDWYTHVTIANSPEISADEIVRRREFFLAHPDQFAELLKETSPAISTDVDEKYRIYCLGPDSKNALMWSHYADGHRGVCLEFSTRNKIFCCAWRVEYNRDYPSFQLYSESIDDDMAQLLSKSDVWSYEQEYRLVLQERRFAADNEAPMTDNNYLELPDGALTSIIVGCQGPYEEVCKLVNENAPDVAVKRAVRLPDRYALSIE